MVLQSLTTQIALDGKKYTLKNVICEELVRLVHKVAVGLARKCSTVAKRRLHHIVSHFFH